MTALQAKDTFKQVDHPAFTIESAMSNLVRAQIAEQRPDDASGLNESLSSLLNRVAGHSAEEIDALIEELNRVRNFLRTEGKRIQREISQYAQLNQSAMSSIQMIGDAFGPWKSAHLDKQPASAVPIAPDLGNPDDKIASSETHAGSALPNQA